MEHFEPLPQNRQVPETRRKAPVVHNPHHPHNKAAAVGMALAQPNSPMPSPRMPQPMAAPMPAPSLDVPVQVTPNSEAEAVSFGLPSNFLFYDFKDLYIKPFKGKHFRKLHAAREEESLLHVVEAVSDVISTPSIPQGLAFYLTLPDYYACLFWLRINSFLKHGFTHQSMCRNELHIAKVTAGEVAPDTLKHAETINKASLQTRMLEAVPNPEDYVLEYPGIRLVPPLMRDILDVLMNEGIDRFAARTASCIQFEDRNAPLAERMAIIDDMSADDVATIGAFEKAVSDYGVVETIQWRCKTCGVVHTDQIQLEAHSFFPSAA